MREREREGERKETVNIGAYYVNIGAREYLSVIKRECVFRAGKFETHLTFQFYRQNARENANARCKR